MKPQTTVVSIGDGMVCRCDTVTLDGRRWLIRRLPANDCGAHVRTILLDGLSYRPADPAYGADFVLDTVIPIAVWNGRRSDSRFVVEDRTDDEYDATKKSQRLRAAAG